jgi:flagellar assembly factor FliW
MNAAQVLSSSDAVNESSVHAPVAEQAVVGFPLGLAGFEGCRSFVLLAADAAPFQWLTCVEGPPATFLVVDPHRVMPDYRAALGRAEIECLGPDTGSKLLWLAIVLVESDGAVAVNLRAPIAINPETMTGVQVMRPESEYSLRHVIAPAAG